MTNEEIIEKIQQGLKDCSEKYNIAPKDIRVKIEKEVSKGRMGLIEKIKCYVMSNDVVLKNADNKDTEISLSTLLNLNPAVGMLLNKYFKTAFTKLAIKNKICEAGVYNNEGVYNDGINARIFTTSLNFSPSIYLYKGDVAKTSITVEDLTS